MLKVREMSTFLSLMPWMGTEPTQGDVYCDKNSSVNSNIGYHATCWWHFSTVEEEHRILTFCNGHRMLSLPHCQFKSVNIATILASGAKMCLCVWWLDSWPSVGIYISWVESSVNKQIRLNCVLFFHRVFAVVVFQCEWALTSPKCEIPQEMPLPEERQSRHRNTIRTSHSLRINFLLHQDRFTQHETQTGENLS